jgi:hypothetical protein
MVLEFLARLAGQKEKAKQDEWAVEDRSSELEMRNLQKTLAEQGVTKNKQAIQDYRPPISQAEQDFRDRRAARAEDKRRLGEIAARGAEDRKTLEARESTIKKEQGKNAASLRKQYLTAKGKIESDFTKMADDIEGQFTAQVATLRKPSAKNETPGRTVATEGSPYLLALRGAHASRKRMKAELEARKTQQLEQLENDYSARLEGMGNEQPMETAARPQYKEGDVLVGPSGERIVLKNNEWIPIK